MDPNLSRQRSETIWAFQCNSASRLTNVTAIAFTRRSVATASVIDATITLKDGPIHRSGFLNYLALSRNLAQPAPSAFVVNRIPGANESTPATPVSMKFHFRETDAAKGLQPRRLLNAFYVKGAASAFVVPEPTRK
jgi:hypothetical protein